MVTVPTACFALVVTPEGLAGLYFGTARDAWEHASRLSARRHIVWLPEPMNQVLSVMPPMYADLWTAGKGMYKIEPVVADGGEVIIYAPHIREVSFTHGKVLDEIGYHCRDYFLAQPEKFARYPGGVVAHSTHVKGLGTYDRVTGIETPRVRVTLSTGIPEQRCRRINLGYRDPATIDIAAFSGREREGILVVPRAGEMLYRLKPR
jgi:nickel-dependent lactate racemase